MNALSSSSSSLMLMLLAMVMVVMVSLSSVNAGTHVDVSAHEWIPGQRYRQYTLKTAWSAFDGPDRLIYGLGLRSETQVDLHGPFNAKALSGTWKVDAAGFYINTLASSAVGYAYYHRSTDFTGTRSANVGAATDSDLNFNWNADATLFASWVRPFAIVEYNETNGVDGLQVSDQIIGWYKLDKASVRWKPFNYTRTTVTANGTDFDAFTIVAQTDDDVFLIRLTIAGAPVYVDNHPVTPDTAKIGFEIRWFDNEKFTPGIKKYNPWTKLDCPLGIAPGCIKYSTGPSAHTDTRVALLTVAAASTTGIKTTGRKPLGNGGSGPESPAVQWQQTSGVTGFFTWDGDADVTVTGATLANKHAVINAEFDTTDQFGEVDGGSIVKNIDSSWTFKFMAFAFNESHPSLVSWDPEIGAEVDYTIADDADSNGASAPVASALFLLLSVLLAVVLG